MNELAQYLPGILLSYVAFTLAILVPGPNMLAVMSASMNIGRRAGMSVALGIVMGSLSWALLSVLGISAVIASYAPLLYIIKILGGFYLLYLAWKTFVSIKKDEQIELKGAKVSHSKRQLAVSGYLITMTNPKAILAWVAIVAIGIQEGSPWWVGALLICGTFTIAIITYMSYAIFFSTPAMVSVYIKFKRYIQAVFGAFFAIAGLKLLSNDN